MSPTRKLLVPLLAGVLVAMLLGSGAVTAAEPRATVGKITIPAAAFIPTTDDIDYLNNGWGLYPSSGSATFVAPLVFPVERVKIRKLTLYAYDNAPGTVTAYLQRATPHEGTSVYQAIVGTSDDPADPQAASTRAISPRWVSTLVQGPFVFVVVSPGLMFYGVTVNYSY